MSSSVTGHYLFHPFETIVVVAISIHLLSQTSDLQCIFESTNCNFTEGPLPCSYSPSAPIFSVEIGPGLRDPDASSRTAHS